MFGKIEKELLEISLFGELRGAQLRPEQIWSELQAYKQPIGWITGLPVFLRDRTHEGRTCIMVTCEGTKSSAVGEDTPDMILVLTYFEEALQGFGEEQAATTVAGARIWYTQHKLAFDTTARLSAQTQPFI